MRQRFITGVVLVLLVSFLIYLGGIAIALTELAVVSIALYEVNKTLKLRGHRLIVWPAWAADIAAIPLLLLCGPRAVMPLILGTAIITIGIGLFRESPALDEIVIDALPLFSVVLPGMCLESLNFTTHSELHRMLVLLTIAVPVLGDTLAYFVGSALRGAKFCPEVSPNKTISGAIGGMVGSILAAAIIGLTVNAVCSAEVLSVMPRWWFYLIVGLLGGAAAQIGDLFASLIKRHCGIKDFSNLFPGHGGMMDRMDSIFFSSIVVYCVCLMWGMF